MIPKHIAIIGLGVMGGSLLLAVKKHLPTCKVSVITRNKDSQVWAERHGACFVNKSVQSLQDEFDFIFIAIPSQSLEKVAKDLLNHHKSAIISDLASAKGVIATLLSDILQQHRYLSCHPMCGSEKTGLDGVKPDLYEQKTVVITPHDKTSKQWVEPLKVFWEFLNCKIKILTPFEHDQCVAWVSHMPHLLMSVLVHALNHAEKDHPQVFEIAGTGLRDITRLAASNPELWNDIVLENLSAIKNAVLGMRLELNHLEQLLNFHDKDCDQLKNYLTEANKIHHTKSLSKI